MEKEGCSYIFSEVVSFSLGLSSTRTSSLQHSLLPRPSYHGVPVRGPGNNGLRMRLIKTARYA